MLCRIVLVGNPEYCCVCPSWCQICPHGSFCCLYGPRVKTNHGAGFVCWWCVVSGLYSQGWEDGDRMVALPIALTAPSLSMETVVSGPSTYIHTYIHRIPCEEEKKCIFDLKRANMGTKKSKSSGGIHMYCTCSQKVHKYPWLQLVIDHSPTQPTTGPSQWCTFLVVCRLFSGTGEGRAVAAAARVMRLSF